MSQRIIDILLVALVLASLKGLFELTRVLLRRFISLLEKRGRPLNRDSAIQWGMGSLLAGLLLLPFFTSILAIFDNRRLAGGIVLHLILVAVSIVLFSFAEDLIRIFNSCPIRKGGMLSVSAHLKRMAPVIMVFWATGFLLLSPIFYSALSVLVVVFYIAVLHGRRRD